MRAEGYFPLMRALVVAVAVVLAAAALAPSSARAAAVSGSCPPPVALRQCSPTCQAHSECPGRLLCCSTACGGTACVRPVTDVRRAQQRQDEQGPGCCPKPGACPSVYEAEWLCTARCRGDFDCDAASKCCPTRCGAADCMAPAEAQEG